MRLLPLSLLILAAVLSTAIAQPPPTEYKPFVAPASDEGAKAMKRFRLPQGVEARLWAAEPLLANPVSFAFDEKGRCYVAETFRLHHGVTDNRGHMNWLEDDLASRTVEDRIAMHKKFAGTRFHQEYEIEHDRVRLIEDTTGKGVADKNTVFADGFHNAADGIGAGVLARKGNVYYTCLPDLWLLKDTRGTGKADVKKSLAYGFGVHVAFLGHDMHGLRIGPDGRLYFSIGDRGLNVKTSEGKQLFNPDSGAVLRCELDGSHLEIVATGLRNPQELAFDQFGNLFTVDNNSDSGDQVRLTYIVPGGDSGWRTGYQYGSSLSDRGPFNAEKIWHLKTPPEQPAYIVPPLAHICSGPSGFCFNYGATALPERYDNHFFICDFRGGPGGSGVYSFAVKPKGAAFELVDGHEAFWSILATDCDFGPDGGFYVSDWVDGWEITGKGRLYRFADPQAEKKPIVAETKRLLAAGFDQRPTAELEALLGHADLRVRQGAQMALADPQRQDGLAALTRVARAGTNQLARLHAVWGLGQIGRRDYPAVSGVLDQLVADADPLLRVQVLKLYGEAPSASPAAAEAVAVGLVDAEPRVRFEAAITLRNKVFHHGDSTLKALVAYLKDNGTDGYLRHAGVMALASLGESAPASIAALSNDPSPTLRLAAVLALRRLHAVEIARFLTDADPQVVLEAARAVNDEDALAPVLPQLAALLTRPITSEFVTARALNAHFRLGKADNAAAVAAFAARADAPDKWRVEAVKMLGDWTRPGRRDRITGLTTNLGTRDAALGGDALRAHLGGLFTGSDKLRAEAATVAGKLGIKEVGPLLFEVVRDSKRPALVRAETLKALAKLKDPRLEQALTLALADTEPRLRAEARTLQIQRQPKEAVQLLAPVLEKGETVEQQAAFAALARAATPEADGLLAGYTARLAAGQVPPELRLDLVEAATARFKDNTPPVLEMKKHLAAHEAARDPKDPLARYRDSLEGGDPEAGRRLFFYKAEVYCQRCHKVDGVGGIVGPELNGIGSKQKRDYLLESIVLPNAQIAKGYESVVLILKNGKSETGILKAENAQTVQIMNAEGQLKTIAKDRIDERLPGKSAMPEDLVKHLSPRELRDLVAFLAAMKEKGKDP